MQRYSIVVIDRPESSSFYLFSKKLYVEVMDNVQNEIKTTVGSLIPWIEYPHGAVHILRVPNEELLSPHTTSDEAPWAPGHFFLRCP
jgi:hypothetical protein